MGNAEKEKHKHDAAGAAAVQRRHVVREERIVGGHVVRRAALAGRVRAKDAVGGIALLMRLHRQGVEEVDGSALLFLPRRPALERQMPEDA